MRKLAVLLLFPAIAIAAAPVSGGAASPPARHFAVEPIRIEPKPGDPGQIRGQFELKLSPQAQPALLRGGACMVRQFDGAKTCSTDSDCKVADPSVYGYCADAPGAAAKSCWYKPPGPNTVMCNQSPGADLPKSTPLYTPWVAVGAQRPVSWRVVTCQNIVPMGCAKVNGEQGVHYIRTYGVPHHYPALPPVARPGGG